MSADRCTGAAEAAGRSATVTLRRRLLGRLLNREAAAAGTAWLPARICPLRATDARETAQLLGCVGLAAAAPHTIAAQQVALAAAFRAAPVAALAAPEQAVAIAAVSAGLRAVAIPGFGRLRSAAREVAAHTGATVLLHGSLASDDWTSYRDADLLLVVPERICGDPCQLARLRRWCAPLLAALYRFDPLQHHGLFVLPEGELAAYPEHYLPVATLRRSLDLGGSGCTLRVRASHDLAAARAEFDWVVDYLAHARPPGDAHGWKAYASVLMLLPALWLSAAGRPCWKGDSFALVEPLSPPSRWEPQRWAARLRTGWQDHTPRWLLWLMAVTPDPRLVARAGRRFVRAPAGLLPADPGALLCAAYELAVHLRGRLPSPAAAP